MKRFSAQSGIGALPLIIAFAAVGVVGYILLANAGTFKKEPAVSLYQKTPSQAATQQTGNGGPSGAHYNLNLIGVPKGKTASMTGGDAHRIFVPLEGTCKINLSAGDFQVIDGNCTDGPSAFQLPNPDPDNNGLTEYSVYARALGKPGGSATANTCATDPVTGELWCSVYSTVLVRDKGKSSFTNISKVLLYVYADINADGQLERYPLFDTALQDYYWNYDNNGLKVVQLRFYQISTNVN